MGFKKFSPVQFGQKYLEALDKGIIQKVDIIKYMKISSATFYAYWKDPDYRAQTENKIDKYENKVKGLKLGTNHREKIIETAYRLHEQGIAKALSQKSWAKARRISIDALKICKTEMEIERIFIVMGNMNVSNTVSNTQINITQERLDIASGLLEIVRGTLLSELNEEVADRLYGTILTRLKAMRE